MPHFHAEEVKEGAKQAVVLPWGGAIELPAGAVAASLKSARDLWVEEEAAVEASERLKGNHREGEKANACVLPESRLVECVCQGPSVGGQLLVESQLEVFRKEGQYCAVIDVANAMAPCELGDTLCEHVLWVKCRNAAQGLKALDIVLRDDNFAMVVADLRCPGDLVLRGFPLNQWYRLQRLVHQRSMHFLMLSYATLCPAADVRLSLEESYSLAALDEERVQLRERLLNKVRKKAQRHHSAERDVEAQRVS